MLRNLCKLGTSVHNVLHILDKGGVRPVSQTFLEELAVAFEELLPSLAILLPQKRQDPVRPPICASVLHEVAIEGLGKEVRG